MGLKLLKDNGCVRKVWYAQYKERGKWKVKRLTTPMRGERIPKRLTDEGDDAFERSREAAQLEFEEFERRRMIKGSAEDIQIAIVESKTGKKVEYVRLDELPAKWLGLPRSYTPTANSIDCANRYFDRFAAYAKVTYLYEVTQDMASSFFNSIRNEYSWSTVKDTMSVLKSAFARFLPVGMVNPFASVIKRNRELNAAKVHRRPLSETELQALFVEASKDSMLNSLAITAACTGMRIGDVCNLKWESVDLKAGFVTVLTAKAGQLVTIPIFDPLRKVLEVALSERIDGEQHVFPEAARMYAGNPDGIIHRGKMLFARALFHDKAKQKAEEDVIDTNHKNKTPAEILECIRNAGYAAKKAVRVEKVYTLYSAGLTYRQIERETGLSRGQICDYLHGVEDITGNSVVRWSKECATSNRKLLDYTRQERSIGQRSASLYGWHSLRASFVVAALTHGIPVEVVRKVVGHSTADMTLEYFNPTKNIIADTMRRKMKDSVLGGGAPMITDSTVEDRKLSKADVAHDGAGVENGELMDLAAKLAKLSPAKRKQLQALLSKVESV